MKTTRSSAPPDKSSGAVRGMFGRIARRYDLLNRILSGGSDILWRRKAAKLLDPGPGEVLLDLCSGTGDLALDVRRRSPASARIVAADFTFEMLALGRVKFAADGAGIPEIGADALALPFPAGCFHGVTAAFGVRNFEDPDRGFREAARVLRPGGRFVVLEFTPEPTGLFAPFVRLYCRSVLPIIGRVVSGDASAYAYLPESVGLWPSPEALAGRLRLAGFASVEIHRLPFGIAAIHVARKGAAS